MDRKDPAMKTVNTNVKATKKTVAPAPAPAAPAKKDAKPAPANALAAKYTGALAATVKTLVLAAQSAASAGLTVAERLAEAFAMDPHRVTGHDSPTAWAHALLSEACPMAGQSTVYAWIEAGCARAAVVAAGQDPALFPMDTLRVIGSKSVTGQDPKRMAALASELAADPALRNGAGKVDPKKARASVNGTAIDALSRKEKVQKLARIARKLGGNGDAARDLLAEAAALIAKG